MKVGAGNYVYSKGSKLSKVWVIRDTASGYVGVVDIRGIYFPKHCIGKRVRLKVEFVDEPDKFFDKHNNLVEVVLFEGDD